MSNKKEQSKFMKINIKLNLVIAVILIASLFTHCNLNKDTPEKESSNQKIITENKDERKQPKLELFIEEKKYVLGQKIPILIKDVNNNDVVIHNPETIQEIHRSIKVQEGISKTIDGSLFFIPSKYPISNLKFSYNDKDYIYDIKTKFNDIDVFQNVNFSPFWHSEHPDQYKNEKFRLGTQKVSFDRKNNLIAIPNFNSSDCRTSVFLKRCEVRIYNVITGKLEYRIEVKKESLDTWSFSRYSILLQGDFLTFTDYSIQKTRVFVFRKLIDQYHKLWGANYHMDHLFCGLSLAMTENDIIMPCFSTKSLDLQVKWGFNEEKGKLLVLRNYKKSMYEIDQLERWEGRNIPTTKMEIDEPSDLSSFSMWGQRIFVTRESPNSKRYNIFSNAPLHLNDANSSSNRVVGGRITSHLLDTSDYSHNYQGFTSYKNDMASRKLTTLNEVSSGKFSFISYDDDYNKTYYGLMKLEKSDFTTNLYEGVDKDHVFHFIDSDSKFIILATREGRVKVIRIKDNKEIINFSLRDQVGYSSSVIDSVFINDNKAIILHSSRESKLSTIDLEHF